MKISQRYPQIMDFYEKWQNNEHFPASNAIDFGKTSLYHWGGRSEFYMFIHFTIITNILMNIDAKIEKIKILHRA